MPRWTLSKTVRFEASHQLPNHDGKCRRLHGHSWKATIKVESDQLHDSGSQSGMVADYGVIGQPLKALVDATLDHHHLNDTTGLTNPTSEELARWMFNQLRPRVPELVAVVVEETCTSACEYRP